MLGTFFSLPLAVKQQEPRMKNADVERLKYFNPCEMWAG